MLKHLLKVLLFLFIVFVIYILSVLWRVSVAEKTYYGRSDLLPTLGVEKKYSDNKLSQDAYGSGSYYFNQNGRKIIVWRQKINGFQHVYGPALVAFELGDNFSDKLFCANEFMEAFFDLLFDPNGISIEDILDRRKDLFHNAFGRKIALETKMKNLSGEDANQYMLHRILAELELQKNVIPHYEDPRVRQLPSETEMGCPGLPPRMSLYH